MVVEGVVPSVWIRLAAAIPATGIALFDLLGWTFWRFMDSFTVGATADVVAYRAVLRALRFVVLLAAVVVIIAPPRFVARRLGLARFVVLVTVAALLWAFASVLGGYLFLGI